MVAYPNFSQTSPQPPPSSFLAQSFSPQAPSHDTILLFFAWLRDLWLFELRPHETRIALLVGATSSEAEADKGGPGAAFEEEDAEDHAEGEAEGRADEEGGKAAVPLLEKRLVSFGVFSSRVMSWTVWRGEPSELGQ